jgi:membrane protease YdiL (CAAX protease family)
MRNTATGVAGLNTPHVIARRYAERSLSWAPVMAFLPARFVLVFLAEAVTAALLWLRGVPDPWQASYGWWMVYGTLTDIGCLVLLTRLTRREAMGIVDLLGLDSERLGKQLRYFPGYLVAFFVPVVLTFVISGLFYGSELPPQVAAIHVPFWAKGYSVVIWPVIWCFTEDVVYVGYLLPRLEARTKQPWFAVCVVVLFWGIQHVVIPFIPDARYLLSRFITALVTVGGLTCIFTLWGRRLVAAIGVHWVADVLAALLANFRAGV